MITDSQHYSDIADAIREKLDTQETYEPGDMAEAIESISGGGTVSAPIEIKEINPLNGKYKKVVVNSQTIPDYAFTGQDELEEVIGENVTSVGDRAFATISNASDASAIIQNFSRKVRALYASTSDQFINTSIPIKIKLPNLTSVGPNAFSKLRKEDDSQYLSNPDFLVFSPEKITQLSEYAFVGYRGRFKIMQNGEEIEPEALHFDNLTAIPANCFYGARMQINIECPILESVSDFAFDGTSSSQSLQGFLLGFFAPKMQNVNMRAFRNQIYLSKLWIKSGGTVGGEAFKTGSNLDLFTDATEWEANWNVNAIDNATCTVHYGATYQDFLDFVPDTETEGA